MRKKDSVVFACPSRVGRRWLAAGLACLVASCMNPPRRDPATVLFASGADLQSINPLVAVHPLARQVQKYVLFRTLAAYDENLVPVPDLSTWEWSTDGTLLQLFLEPDVTWQDGVKTTAQDVAWTVNAARDERTAYPRAGELQEIVDVRVVDSLTLTVRFARPQPSFPEVLTDLSILPAHIFEGVPYDEVRSHPFNRSPVGNGPFRFVEYLPNQRWVFTRRGASDSSNRRVERFVVVVVDESTTKLAALTAGELDFAGINPAHANFVRDDPGLDVLDYPVQFAIALVWNLRREPFDNIDVRRAMTMALDREQLVDAYVYGFGSVADGPVSPGHRWFEATETVRYDPEAAEAALDRLGWVRGSDGIRQRGEQRLSFELLATASGENALEQMVQAQLADVGVQVRIRVLELSSFLSVAQGPERDYDALVVGVPGDLSLGHVAAMYSGQAGPLAYPGYANPSFDGALRRARRALTQVAVEDAWREAQRILASDHPTTWLYHARGVQGYSRRMRNVGMDLRGELVNVLQWMPGDRVR